MPSNNERKGLGMELKKQSLMLQIALAIVCNTAYMPLAAEMSLPMAPLAHTVSPDDAALIVLSNIQDTPTLLNGIASLGVPSQLHAPILGAIIPLILQDSRISMWQRLVLVRNLVKSKMEHEGLIFAWQDLAYYLRDLGSLPYWQQAVPDLYNLIDGLALDDAQKTQCFMYLTYRLILSPNQWTRRDKLTFMDNVTQFATHCPCWGCGVSSSELPPVYGFLGEKNYNTLISLHNAVSMNGALDTPFCARSCLSQGRCCFVNPLTYIVLEQNIPALAVALECGAQVNAHDCPECPYSPLAMAVATNLDTSLKSLLLYGASLNYRSNQENAFLDAIELGNQKAVHLMLKYAKDQVHDALLDHGIELAMEHEYDAIDALLEAEKVEREAAKS